MKRFKFPLMMLALGSIFMGLSILYAYLRLSPPLGLTVTLLVLASIADYLTTLKASSLGAKEGNPLVNLLFKGVGVKVGGLITLAFLVPFILLMFVKAPAYGQLALGCTYWIVPVNNLMVIRGRMHPKAGS